MLRATRIPDGRPVVLKTSRYAPTPEQVARLTREFEMARRLSSVPGVIEAIELLSHDGNCVMVMDDLGGGISGSRRRQVASRSPRGAEVS